MIMKKKKLKELKILRESKFNFFYKIKLKK